MPLGILANGGLLLLLLLLSAQPVAAQPQVISSGDLKVEIAADGKYTLQVGELPPVESYQLTVFVGGRMRTISNGGLNCTPATAPTTGADKYGAYTGVELNCNAGASAATAVPVIFGWRAYSPSSPAANNVGKVLYAIRSNHFVDKNSPILLDIVCALPSRRADHDQQH